MTPLQPFKPKDFANLFTPVIPPPIIPPVLPTTNAFPDPPLPPVTGNSNTLLYVGLGALTIGVIVLGIIVINNHNAVTRQLSKISLDMKTKPYLLTSTKSTNNATTEQSTAKPESEQATTGEEGLNKI